MPIETPPWEMVEEVVPAPDEPLCPRCFAKVTSHFIVPGVDRPLCPAPIYDEEGS